MKHTSLQTLMWTSVVCAAMALSPSQAQTTVPTKHQQADSLFSLWKLPNHPGGVAAWIEKGEVAWSGAYGLASLEYQVPVTAETVFNTGSVAKQFTAFAMVLLALDGKLSIDDDIRKYLPEVPDFGAVITIRHLLTHTSGLRNFQDLLVMAGWRQGDHMTNNDLLKYISWQKELNFPTGSEYLYCNTGFNLCTAIVERITGKSFSAFTQERIFKPLGMNTSGFRDNLERIYPNTATSYEGFVAMGYTRPKEFWTYTGNGNVYSTVGDLAKWLGNFGNPEVGGPQALEMLSQRGVLNNGDTLTYALGIINQPYRGLRVLQHGGAIGGYRAQLTYFPEKDAGVVVLTNFSSSNPAEKANALAEIFLEGQFPEPKPEQRNAPISPTPPEKPKEDYSLLLKQLQGNYFSEELKTTYTLILKEGKLFAQHPRHADFEVIPVGMNDLRSNMAFFSQIKVVRTPGKKIKGIRVSTGRVRDLYFEKI